MNQDRQGSRRWQDRARTAVHRSSTGRETGVGSLSGTSRLPDLPAEAERVYFLKRYLSEQSAAGFRFGRSGSVAECWKERLRHVLGVRFEPGHSIGILRNGDEIFPGMLDAIECAEHSIECQSFIFWKGEIAERFCRALVERAAAGVRVRIVLDGVGSAPMPSRLRKQFERSAVDVRTFHPVPHWKFWGLDTRTHRRILAIDGKRAFTGGVGIAEAWTGDADDADHFRETQFEITGPAVGALRAAFFASWAAAGGAFPADIHIPGPTRSTGVGAAVVASQGAEEWSKAALMFQGLVRLADERLEIVTPYFVPGSALAEALVSAARRGVQIRIMVSGRNTDHRLSRWAAQRTYRELIDAGIEIHEYDRTLLHTKAVIVDRRLCCIGSPNMNQRSQRLDDEIAVLVDDPKLADELLGDFDADRAACRIIDRETWSRRGVVQRLREWWAGRLEAQL